MIDSEAFADLSASCVVVLLLLGRNLSLGGNGHVFLCAADAKVHGVDKKTLYRALLSLRIHGFIYETSCGGHGTCSRFALTWLPLSKDTKKLHVSNFKPCAWRDWKPPTTKKSKEE